MVKILNDNWQIAIEFNWQLTLYALCAIIGGETKSGGQVYIQGYTI